MPWLKLKKDGTVDQQLYDRPKPIKGWHETPRMLNAAIETWRGGKIVFRDVEAQHAAIDAAHHADFPGRLAIDYAVKEIEARIILGTLATEGRLAAEAKVRGVALEDLAREVLSKAKTQMGVELKRVKSKVKVASQ